jgi:hypothetical protein
MAGEEVTGDLVPVPDRPAAQAQRQMSLKDGLQVLTDRWPALPPAR